jgi:hypothetical protein
VGRGYSTAMPSNSNVPFTGGHANFGDKDIEDLTFTGTNQDFSGWHLLGNPYPSAIDWDLGTWNKVSQDGTVYVFDETQYLCWPYHLNFGTMSNGILPVGQGFMVHVTSPGPGSITIPEDARVHHNQPFYKTAVPDLLALIITGNGYSDKMLIHFKEGATEGFDPEYDAYKLFGIHAAPQLYSMIPDTKLTINVLSAIDKNPVIPLGLKVGASGSYSITATETSSFAAGTKIYLEDLLLQKTVTLSDDAVYSFTARPGDVEHRFNVLFNLVGMPQLNTISNSIKIYSFEKNVYVNMTAGMDGEITIYNLLGRKIISKPISRNLVNKISLTNPAGYYIVKVAGDKGVRTDKIFINQ